MMNKGVGLYFLIFIVVLLISGSKSEAGEVHLLPFETVQKKCQSQIAWEHIKRAAKGQSKTRLIANGCFISSTGEVYVRNDLSPSKTREVIRHELKHKNTGWRH